MNAVEYAYNALLNTVGYCVLPLLKSKTGKDYAFWQGRTGNYITKPSHKGTPRLWFHAASVGEVTGVLPTLHAVQNRLPHADLSLTVATPQGFDFARTHLPQAVQVYPFPLDFPRVLRKTLQHLRPHLYVALESEFWPNLFRLLRKNHIPALLLNGRLSRRSAQRYHLWGPLFEPIFKQFRFLAMHSEEDRQNVLRLGALPERTLMLGSAKYDGLLLRTDPQKVLKWRSLLDLPPSVPVAIGGSLRGSECIQLLEVFLAVREHQPQLTGIFAPRHMEQIPSMVQWLQSRDLPFHLLSHLEDQGENRQFPIVLIDRIGILFELYALGDLIFCGGTLEPIGGHNILEPAAWEKPIFYGPHLEKVRHEHDTLKAHQGSFLVDDATQLAEQWNHWVRHLSQLEPHGHGAGEALKELGGVTEKQVELIVTTLREFHGFIPQDADKNLRDFASSRENKSDVIPLIPDEPFFHAL